jgi:hypothetical protein
MTRWKSVYSFAKSITLFGIYLSGIGAQMRDLALRWLGSQRSMGIQAIAFGKFGRGGTDDELAKPLKVIQRV